MRVLFLFFVITIFALLQSSFFVHFPIYGIIPNFLFLIVLVYNLLENHKEREGLYVAIFAGFWMDVFSIMPIGFYIAAFLLLAFLLKKILKKYVAFTVS